MPDGRGRRYAVGDIIQIESEEDSQTVAVARIDNGNSPTEPYVISLYAQWELRERPPAPPGEDPPPRPGDDDPPRVPTRRVPPTGDSNSNLYLPLLLLSSFSLAGIVALDYRKRRKRK
jgi:hypothetical protein